MHSQFLANTPAGAVEINLPLAGEHNRMNALAAIAATISLGIQLPQIKQGLASMVPVKGRLCPMKSEVGALFIDDSYNANPDSVSAAIKVLAQASGRKILVLGELAELGADTKEFYRELGALARTENIDFVLTVGEASIVARSYGNNGFSFTTSDELVDYLQKMLVETDVVLIKGSRSAAMENVINPFMKSEAS